MVETDLHLSQTHFVCFAEWFTGRRLANEVMFLVDQRGDPIEDIIIHGQCTSFAGRSPVALARPSSRTRLVEPRRIICAGMPFTLLLFGPVPRRANRATGRLRATGREGLLKGCTPRQNAATVRESPVGCKRARTDVSVEVDGAGVTGGEFVQLVDEFGRVVDWKSSSSRPRSVGRAWSSSARCVPRRADVAPPPTSGSGAPERRHRTPAIGSLPPRPIGMTGAHEAPRLGRLQSEQDDQQLHGDDEGDDGDGACVHAPSACLNGSSHTGMVDAGEHARQRRRDHAELRRAHTPADLRSLDRNDTATDCCDEPRRPPGRGRRPSACRPTPPLAGQLSAVVGATIKVSSRCSLALRRVGCDAGGLAFHRRFREDML